MKSSRWAAALSAAALCVTVLLPGTTRAQTVTMSVTKQTTPDTFYLGNEARLRYWVYTGGTQYHVAELLVPAEFTFSNGNLIGPLEEGVSFLWMAADNYFEILAFDSAYGAAATDPDTVVWSVSAGDSSGITGGWILSDLRFMPLDTGSITVNGVTLPSGDGPSAFDSNGVDLTVEWLSRTVHVVPGELRFSLSTNYSDRRLIVGEPGAIYFKTYSTGLTLADIRLPLIYHFSNGNVIGPLQEGVSVLPGADAALFDSLIWSPEYENATDPDTTMIRLVSTAGADLSGSYHLWSLQFTPSDTGVIVIDSVTLPGGFAPRATDTGGAPVMLRLTPDTIRVLPDFRVYFNVTTPAGGDTIYLGGPAELHFSIDAPAIEIAGLGWPIIWRFTNGNIVGPLSEGVNVSPSVAAVAAFENIAWNSIYGQGVDPDTSYYGFIDFGGPTWTGSGLVWSATFTPSDTGTIILDSTWFRIGPALGWPTAVSGDGSTLPTVYEPVSIYVVDSNYVPPQPVQIGVGTTSGDDTLRADGSIVFTVDANGYDISAMSFPLLFTFSNGNIVGPLQEGPDFAFSAAAQSVFESLSFHPTHGCTFVGEPTDTLIFGVIDFDGSGWTDSGEIARITFAPSDTGTISIDSSYFPPVSGMAVLDQNSQLLPFIWDSPTLVVAETFASESPKIDITAGTAIWNDTMFVGGEGSIVFEVDPTSWQIGRIEFALAFSFSNGNIIGPVRRGEEFLVSALADSAFGFTILNSYHGDHVTDPDTLVWLFEKDSRPGLVTAGEVARITFVPLDTGTITIDSIFVPPGSRLSTDVDACGAPMPLNWQPVTIVVTECAVTIGDNNEDGVINSSDVIYMVNYVFKSGPEPLPMRTVGDVNCTGGLGGSDIIYLVNYVFKGGPAPCACYLRII